MLLLSKVLGSRVFANPKSEMSEQEDVAARVWEQGITDESGVVGPGSSKFCNFKLDVADIVFNYDNNEMSKIM